MNIHPYLEHVNASNLTIPPEREAEAERMLAVLRLNRRASVGISEYWVDFDNAHKNMILSHIVRSGNEFSFFRPNRAFFDIASYLERDKVMHEINVFIMNKPNYCLVVENYGLERLVTTENSPPIINAIKSRLLHVLLFSDTETWLSDCAMYSIGDSAVATAIGNASFDEIIKYINDMRDDVSNSFTDDAIVCAANLGLAAAGRLGPLQMATRIVRFCDFRKNDEPLALEESKLTGKISMLKMEIKSLEMDLTHMPTDIEIERKILEAQKQLDDFNQKLDKLFSNGMPISIRLKKVRQRIHALQAILNKSGYFKRYFGLRDLRRQLFELTQESKYLTERLAADRRNTFIDAAEVNKIWIQYKDNIIG